MPQPLQCTFKKEFLRNATILYIEDEEIIRSEASEIFAGFFKKVLIARDGHEGLETFLEHRSEIDIVLTDINMPRLSGIDLLSEIRKIDWELPILITTAFKEVDTLLKAIKFNVTNYIVKPMQLNTTLKIISMLMENKEYKKELARQENELKQFMSILDSNNLICELDLNFKILSANDSYLINSGFELDEIIGKKLNDKNISCNCEQKDSEIIDCISNGKTWIGTCKRSSKKGIVYHTYSTILPIFYNSGRIKKYIEFGTLVSKYENEILALKKHIYLMKSENFRTNSELKNENNTYALLAKKLQKQIDESVNNAQQLLFEIYDLKKTNIQLEEKLKVQEKRFDEFQATIMTKESL